MKVKVKMRLDSYSYWAGFSHCTYLCERDSAVLVLVHFLYDLGGLLLADVEAARHDQTLELLTRDAPAVVLVQTVECFKHVEVGHSLEALAGRLSGDLATEMGAPEGPEFKLGVREEAVVAAVQWVSMV